MTGRPLPVTTSVAVALAGRGYDILIGPGILAGLGAAIRERLGSRRLILVTDANVARHHLPAAEASLLAAGFAPRVIVLTPGEESKDIHRFPVFAEQLLDSEPDRSSLIVALGGGVIGDLAGFAAAVLLRGIDFVQVPTTLLAQIDSSVGGKTGVNARQGKNLIGAFHQPRLVLADLDTLATLPAREMRAGYAEMIKYGLLGDAAFFERLETQGDAILAREPALLADAIAHCCRMKAAIVAEDERESGRRALLNLGHTFGHAFEAETGFGQALLHGEAVGLGLALAAALSVRLGDLDPALLPRIRAVLRASGLPTCAAEVPGGPFPVAPLIAHMRHDKKTIDGKLTFITLRAIGEAVITRDVPEAEVAAALEEDAAGKAE